MKNTALTGIHESLGARMVEFAGYNMPVQYQGVNIEHLQVRKSVGVFDVSHMGEFIVRGEKALDLVQRITSNDASKLYVGKVQYSCFPNPEGGIIDDLLVYRMGDEEYMLVVNASNIEKDWNWVTKNAPEGVELINKSEETSLLAVQGPKAVDVIKKLTDVDVENMKYYTFETGQLAGKDGVIISATGYTGSGGFELYFKNEDAEDIWNAVMEAGEEFGILPCGLAARDTLRLEMGFCLYGNDIDDTTSPIEAGLSWITKTNKDFIGKDVILKHKKEGAPRKLVGFEMLEKAVPRHGYSIVNAEGEEIGVVTSGTMSPSLGKGIGMGYVPSGMAKEGNEIYIQIRKKRVAAQIVKVPFYKG